MMFADARIESIMYQVTFNPKTREGDVVVNVSLVDRKDLDETLEIFRQAAEGKSGEEALQAMGQAYGDLIRSNPNRIRVQMQTYAACDDSDVCEVARKGFGSLVEFVERASGGDTETLACFFARGMLINVVASMGLLDAQEPWAQKVLAFCGEGEA